MHTLPIRVCAAQRGRDLQAPDLERGIIFRTHESSSFVSSHLKLEVLSLFNFKKSDDLDFNCLNGLTNLRLLNHWQCHPELVQLLHSQVNGTIISQPECLLQNICELNI